MKRTITVLSDDLTGKEITYGGWEIRGIGDAEAKLHFQSLSILLAALQTEGTLFGMADNEVLNSLAKAHTGV